MRVTAMFYWLGWLFFVLMFCVMIRSMNARFQMGRALRKMCPGVARAPGFWIIRALQGGAIAGLGGVALFNFTGVESRHSVTCLVLAVACTLWLALDLWVIRERMLRRLLRWVEDQEFLVCPSCLYSLRGTGRDDVCPECGERCPRENLEERWRMALVCERGHETSRTRKTRDSH